MELQAVFLPVLSGISRELPSEDRGPSPLGDNGSAPWEQGKSFLRCRPLLEMEAQSALWDGTRPTGIIGAPREHSGT